MSTYKLIGLAKFVWNNEPDTKFDPKYCMDLLLDTEEERKKAEDLKLVVREPDDSHEFPFVKFQAKIKKPEDLERNRPKTYDSRGNIFMGQVGWGSKVAVKFGLWSSPKSEDDTMYPIWKTLQVLNLVSYDSAVEPDVYEDGFVAENEGSSTGDEPAKRGSAEGLDSSLNDL